MDNNELGLHKIEKSFKKRIDETKSKIYEGSLRSGKKIEYKGTIVILGDVNAGAEVIAGENVIVMGIIRGLAHAGANGNKSAIIVANEIRSPQLRIADIVKEIEKEDNIQLRKKAYIKNDEIIIE